MSSPTKGNAASCGGTEHRDAITAPTMAERAEEALRQPQGETFIVVGVYRDEEEEDGSLQRFADEYASATGWEGAEAAAKEEHPALDVAAVLKVVDGKVRVCDAEGAR